PFVGKKEQTKTQKADLLKVLGKLKGAGNLDYVTGWYAIASRMIAGKQTGVAFVSTNSITQGEQAPSFGKLLESENVTIRFAHRTFRWDSEANEKAHVHCVIIGFGNDAAAEKAIYVNDEKLSCSNINVYLLDAPSVIIESRTRTICDVPQISYGSMPIDDGHLILDEDARDALLAENENNNRFIRNYAGGAELLKNKARWCIWLHGCAPAEYKKSRFIMERISLTQKFRQSSSRPQTLALADTPMLFGEIRQPSTPMLAIPKVSSERRRYIPISYVNPETIINGSALIIPDADMYIFGVLTSNVHMAWMRVVAGRLETRYQYSGNVVYNNFPWPSPALEQRQKIENTAQGILDARALYPDNTLADLYDPLTMPPELRKAHDRNNAAVMKAYGFPTSMSEAECVAALMRMYQELTSN
ncbi:MAG: hypothetical protein Q4A32_04955, partial [Lachnospiraceae bacterium]|nr:hypothetical protein [Lachnospiraceae bacterium]